MTLEADSTSVVSGVLVEAGLEHLKEGFHGVTLETFRTLMIQDYEKYGVNEVEDKQALFKVLKDLDTYLSLHVDHIEECVEHESRIAPRTSKSNPDPMEDRYNGLELPVSANELGETELVDLSVDPAFLLEDDTGMNDIVNEVGCLMQDLEEEAWISSVAAPTSMVDDAALNICGFPSKAEKQSAVGQTSAVDISQIVDPPRIRVIVRKRPLNAKEEEKGEIDVIECNSALAALTVYEPKTKVDMTKYIETHQFRFDDVFDVDVGNDCLYAQSVRPLVATVFKSGRGTCFAYGQTGSGKTYTMQPLPLRAAADIFRICESVEEFRDISLYIACYEIYGGKVFDLLNSRQRLEVREDGKRRVQVVGLKEIRVDNLVDLSRLCDHAACSRSTGSTGANDESSRSHSILTFSIRKPRSDSFATPAQQKFMSTSKSKTEDNFMKTIGKLSFIDLAGSERGADTYDNDKQTRLEGAEINKSLLALKECIRALDMDAGHVPFRGSKLTSVLRDSFMGENARTVMIANISPSSNSCEHTLNTLRYADRVKEMKKDGSTTGKSTSRLSLVAPRVDEVSEFLARMPAPELPNNRPVPPSVKDSDGSQTARSGRKSITTMKSPVIPSKSRSKASRASIVSQQMERGSNNALNTSRAAPSKYPETIDPPMALGSSDNVEIFLGVEDIICAHRQSIENTMSSLREEMDLLAKTDPVSDEYISIDEYISELRAILKTRLGSIMDLKNKVEDYKKMKASKDSK
jgi:kinesin family protein 2/24